MASGPASMRRDYHATDALLLNAGVNRGVKAGSRAKEFPYFRDEVMPRLEKMELRQPLRRT